MRKLIAAINMTLDGFCDHTAVLADEELHVNANRLFRSADTVLFGRVTYQLMEKGWRPMILNPSGLKAMDEFAQLINCIVKIVFSTTLTTVNWKNSRLAERSFLDEVLALKEQNGEAILVGSPSLIALAAQENLIDEYQLCIQPIILGHGLTLFKNIQQRIDLRLITTTHFASGAMVLIYEPVKKPPAGSKDPAKLSHLVSSVPI